MGFIKEFKEFAVKGNVMDMAVGVIIGGAFGKIVTSLVNDVLMPLIGKLTGGVSFNDLFINLGDGNYQTLAAAQEAGAAVLAYGQFIQNIIDFIIIAFCTTDELVTVTVTSRRFLFSKVLEFSLPVQGSDALVRATHIYRSDFSSLLTTLKIYRKLHFLLDTGCMSILSCPLA